MTTPLRDALIQRINQVGPAYPDIEELVGLGEQRLRRRRLASVAGTGAAVALAIALAVGGTTWMRSADQKPGLIDRPQKHPHQALITTRPIVYSDDVDDYHVGSLHVGDHLVDIDQGLPTRGGWALAVTDAGVVFAKSDVLWFTDGGAPRRIAERPCSPVRSGGSGSLAIWFDCAGDLVVFDTASGEEVARKPLPSCLDKGWYCTADEVVGEHAYFTRQGGASGLQERRHRFDISTGLVVAATDQMYNADLRSHSRGLVLGDSWRTGTATLEVRFDLVGSRLVPVNLDSGPTNAFDAATGRPVRLRLPSGITPILQDPLAGWEGFRLFEWLDDDTIALVQSYEQRPVGGDIITCHLSDGRCRLAVPAGPQDQIRMVPGASYPA